MSESQTVWMVLWNRAARSANPREPFEISEAAPEVAETLKVPPEVAERLIGNLLKELERLPEGEQYFRREGNAVVPLGEFAAAPKDSAKALDAYPYEL